MSPPSNHSGKALFSENADCSIKIQETHSMIPVLNQPTARALLLQYFYTAYLLLLFLLLSILLHVFFTLHSLSSPSLSLSVCLHRSLLLVERFFCLCTGSKDRQKREVHRSAKATHCVKMGCFHVAAFCALSLLAQRSWDALLKRRIIHDRKIKLSHTTILVSLACEKKQTGGSLYIHPPKSDIVNHCEISVVNSWFFQLSPCRQRWLTQLPGLFLHQWHWHMCGQLPSGQTTWSLDQGDPWTTCILMSPTNGLLVKMVETHPTHRIHKTGTSTVPDRKSVV